MSASLFDASIYPDSWFNKHCYYGGVFDKNRVYSERLALHGINVGNAKGKLVRAHHRTSGAFSGAAVSDSTTGEWVMPVTRPGNHFATCIDASTNPVSIADSRDLVCCVPMNGTHGSSSFYDITGNAECVPVGGLTITTSQVDPFGASSGVADLSAEAKYLDIYFPFNINPNGYTIPRQWTLRFWMYMKTLSAASYAYIAGYGGASNTMALTRNASSAGISIVSNGVGNVLNSSGLPATNQWVLVEINRTASVAGTTNRMFYSGALNASGTNATEFSAVNNFARIGLNWTGYACDFQIFTSAKNTAAYTLPTSRVPFSLSSVTNNPLVEDDIQPL
jgi:hypothetical protein